jgi:hypothetical protein
MLVPPKNMASDTAKAQAPVPPSTRVVEVSADTKEPVPHAEDPPRTPAARFEDGKALPDAPAVVAQPDTPAAASPPPQKTAQKRTKSAKRKSAKQQDVETYFYSIQKSLSSMFE